MLHPTDLPNLHRSTPGLGHGPMPDRRRAAEVCAEVGALFAAPTPAEVDTADTAAGAGWSVVALHPDGTAEVLATVPTAGAAAAFVDAATTARRRDAATYGTARVVAVPAYDAAVMVGG